MGKPKSSGSERRRLYMTRVKADATRYDDFKAKDKERWRRKQTETAQSDRAVRKQRKLNREKKRRSRERKKAQEAELQPLKANAQDDAMNTPKARGRKRVRRDRSELYRKVCKLETQLGNEKRRSQRYRKKLQRKTLAEEPTPQKKVRQLLRKCRVTPIVRKTLTFSTALIEGMKKRYRISRSTKEKQLIMKLVQTHVKKYRMIAMAHSALGTPRRITSSTSWSVTTYNRATHQSVGQRWSVIVRDFLCRDDNSRITTGKRDTITRNGVKAQRRIMTKSMLRLHVIFTAEQPQCKMSYSLFCRLRPFYIVPPTNKDRETCLCRLHENGRMVVERMVKANLLPAGISTIEDAVSHAVCPQPQQQCYERSCTKCANNAKDVSSDCTDTITWFQWATLKEKRVIKNKTVVIQRTLKTRIDGTITQLCESYQAILPKLCWHLMVLKQQWCAYQYIKDTGECTIIVDFSENYTTQQNRAVQSAHFGASNNQPTLHTGVVYTRGATSSFCSISDCTRHDPAAICAHMEPVINWVKEENPGIRSIDMWSDGPVTQCRNKKHFLLFSQMKEYVNYSTWSFFEAGHGKGAVDAIGGVIKRAADRAVNTNHQISDAQSFIDVIGPRTKVTLFMVTADDIAAKDAYLGRFPEIGAIKGTMKIHQMQLVAPSVLSVRNLSCFCQAPLPCTCLQTRTIQFPAAGQEDEMGDTPTDLQPSPDTSSQKQVLFTVFHTSAIANL